MKLINDNMVNFIANFDAKVLMEKQDGEYNFKFEGFSVAVGALIATGLTYLAEEGEKELVKIVCNRVLEELDEVK